MIFDDEVGKFKFEWSSLLCAGFFLLSGSVPIS